MLPSHEFGSGRRHQSVAIIGIGCRFPGGVVDVASFWRLVSEGTDAITEIPADRIDVNHFYDPRPATPGRMASRYGGFLDRIDELDATFFGISPREAQSMDPQQRVLLETAWEAFEDAGENVHALEGSRTSVFIGQWVSDFEARLFANPDRVDFAMTTGSGRYATSGRISYVFGLRGASFTIDCACSSSLAAVHLGVQSIRTGEADLALAGGVNMILQPQISIGYSQSRMIAADGRCKFGDASGDGYVRSEGAGLVVLKALDRALADGDRIYAVIRGSSVNNDGRSSGVFGRPSGIGHEEMLRAAYLDAELLPVRVGYIEAHGTGTRAGDPVELAALGAVVGNGRPAGDPCLIGSVKTNFGHTEGAAGIAGLIKASLALYHGSVPASLHFVQPNPNVPWAELPFRIPTVLTAWPAGDQPRVAGVNSFGISGTNAHAVLEEAPQSATPMASAPTRRCPLLPLSAKSPAALRELASRYATLLESGSVDVRDVCWAAATRRTPLEYRAVFVAGDGVTLADALRRFAAGEAAAAEGVVLNRERPKLVFTLPGQGGQWVGMARELAAAEPVFRAALERCEEAALRWTDWRLLEQLHLSPESPGYRLDDIDVIQPVLVALEIAYAELWRSLGIEPDALVGHSMGEVAAAHLAGVLDLDQAMRIICLRSVLMHRTSGQGAMALVELSMEDAQARVAGLEDRLTIAVSNSPRSSVLSGEPQAVQQQLEQLEQEGIFCRLIKVDVASHSAQMEPAAVELAAALEGLATADAVIPIYSTVLARRVDGHECGASYWGRNLRQPVRFGQTVERMLADGMSVFVELGPHPVLLTSIGQTAAAASAPVTTIAIARKDQTENAVMQTAVGALWAAGYPVDWHRVMPARRQTVILPLYPWQRERYWSREAEPVGPSRDREQRAIALTDEHQKWLHILRWVEQKGAPPRTSRQLGGRVLLIAGLDASERTLYGTAFSAEQATIEFVASVDDAAELLRDTTRDDLAAVVLLASAVPDPPGAALTLLQSLATKNVALRPRMFLGTSGAQAVDGYPRPRVDTEQATLWGLGRVIAEEHPELWGGLIDLDPAAEAGTHAANLAAEICRSDAETQVSLRDGRRFVLRLQPLDVDPAEQAVGPWPNVGAWLVSGGLGEVGLHLAAEMVTQGVRRLVLLSRAALPPRTEWSTTAADCRDGRRIAAVRALEAAGAAVHVLVADVGDAADLQRALRGYEDEAWPPIRGVLHAAGVLETALAMHTDRALLQRAFTPKLDGARNLDRLLPQVERFVMISSNSATLGVPGMGSYAAANAGLDALAHDRRGRNLHALSIQSGAWIDTGMHAGESAERKMRQLNDIGIHGFTPSEGVAVFSALAGRPEAAITVMPIDWSAFTIARRGRNLKLYDGRLVVDSISPAAGPALGERFATTTVSERRQLLEPIVREAVGRVLKLAPARIEPRKPLGAMGLNSLMAMELRNRLESDLGRPLSATLAWNYPTVDALVAFLSGHTPAAAAPTTAAGVAPSAAVALAAVANLTDLEAARLLRRKR